MISLRTTTVGILLAVLIIGTAAAQQDKAKYVPKVPYPLFKEMQKHEDSLRAARDSATAAIRARQEKERKRKDSTATELRFDVSRITRPGSPDEFKSIFHFPPTPQDLSGTCWAFSGTSYIESEAFRLSGHKVKLSEMYNVYWEWVEKVRRFVQERGDSRVSSGSEEGALPRIIRKYGAVPREQFEGYPDNYPHYYHDVLDGEISNYLEFVRGHNLWDENEVIANVRVMLDSYIGRPPDSVSFEGKRYTPQQFASEILKLNPDDYVMVMSTLKFPFHTRALFDAGDNWWRDSSYVNLPLDEFYLTIKNAVQKGYSVCIGGGTSEPGYYGMENIGVIPDFDIPQNYINQDSREYRIARGTTGDDHGLHIVGYLKKGGHDWYLVKDSGSGSRKGKLKGYFFFRDDYIRLKMLTFMVHKAALPPGAVVN